MKLSLILQAIDRMSGPAHKAKASIDDLGKRGFGGLGSKIDQARGHMRAFLSETERGERVGRAFGARIREIAQRDFAAFGRGARQAQRAAGGLLKSLGLMAVKGAVGGVLGLGAAAGTGTGIFFHDVIANAAKFEQYQVALEGTEGSAAKAKAAMAWVAKFAKDTPYDIDTVTDAFVRARGVGIDPMTGAFRILGDAAGGTRKTLMDAVEAMADAQTGEFERLKEFNITSSVKGNQVTFSYIDKAGKNATVSVKKSMTEIRRAILDVFDKKYGGGMERQSTTLIGIWSNLQDTITNFELKVANAGIFDRVKSRLQAVLDWTNQLAQDGRLDAWAKEASDRLGELWDAAERFITQTDWRAVASGIGTIVSTLVTVVTWIGKAASAWSTWQNDVERRRLGIIINDKGVLGSGIGAPSAEDKADARRQLDDLDRRQYGQPQGRRSPGGAFVWPASSGHRGTRPTAEGNPWARSSAAQMTPQQRSTWQRALAAPAAKVPLGKVSVDITLRGSGAAAADVGRVKAGGNTSVSVKRGYAMGGPG